MWREGTGEEVGERVWEKGNNRKNRNGKRLGPKQGTNSIVLFRRSLQIACTQAYSLNPRKKTGRIFSCFLVIGIVSY